MPFFVYLLESSDHKNTYVGATIDVPRRLKQHNKLLSGGAKATTSKIANGITWNLICYIQNFPTWNCALQFEWRFKQLTRRLASFSLTPLEKRKMALEELLSLEKSTTRAIPFSEYTPEVVEIEV
jgi:predicted GIY-YIG superfamily endonuclease